MGRYGDLRRFNFVFDAESCRRTIEQSCWSREDFRPDTTVRAVQRLAGQLGDVLVVMSGYNDSSDTFDDAVDAVVAEAQRQAIPHVIWLTLRTADVSYQDPQERASSDGYREDNRTLYEKAEQLGGYLQIADWATYSEDRSDWFFGDGVHLTRRRRQRAGHVHRRQRRRRPRRCVAEPRRRPVGDARVGRLRGLGRRGAAGAGSSPGSRPSVSPTASTAS